MTHPQAQHFDELVLQVIRGRVHQLDRIVERVRDDLRLVGESWATFQSRSAMLKRAVRSSLARLKRAGRIRCDGQGPASRWHVVEVVAAKASAL